MDTWDEGDHYDDYMGRWSRPTAHSFLEWLRVPADARWLDVGCGTGVLAESIVENSQPRGVTAIDPSPGFVIAAQNRLGEKARVYVAGAQDLPFDDASFDAVVSGLALNFFPDPADAMLELRRVTVNQGLVAAYVWDYAEGMELIRVFWDVAVSLDPSISHLDEATRFPLCDPDQLFDLFHGAGFSDVETTGLLVPTVFESFEDYWRPLLGGTGPAPSYVTSLAPDSRNQLALALEKALPADNDTIALGARAWAVRGTV